MGKKTSNDIILETNGLFNAFGISSGVLGMASKPTTGGAQVLLKTFVDSINKLNNAAGKVEFTKDEMKSHDDLINSGFEGWIPASRREKKVRYLGDEDEIIHGKDILSVTSGPLNTLSNVLGMNGAIGMLKAFVGSINKLNNAAGKVDFTKGQMRAHDELINSGFDGLMSPSKKDKNTGSQEDDNDIIHGKDILSVTSGPLSTLSDALDKASELETGGDSSSSQSKAIEMLKAFVGSIYKLNNAAGKVDFTKGQMRAHDELINSGFDGLMSPSKKDKNTRSQEDDNDIIHGKDILPKISSKDISSAISSFVEKFKVRMETHDDLISSGFNAWIPAFRKNKNVGSQGDDNQIFQGKDILKYAYGLNYVPYDNYPALLHEGERVLTASEARSHNSSPSVTITGNNFTVRENADVEKIAKELARQMAKAYAITN